MATERTPGDLLTERDLATLEKFATLCDNIATAAALARRARTRGDADLALLVFDRAMETMNAAEFP